MTAVDAVLNAGSVPGLGKYEKSVLAGLCLQSLNLMSMQVSSCMLRCFGWFRPLFDEFLGVQVGMIENRALGPFGNAGEHGMTLQSERAADR